MVEANDTSGNTPSTKDWIELAKLAQGRIQNRREYEWKLAFGFWAAIGTFTGAFFTIDGFTCPDRLSDALAIAYGVLLLAVFVCWQLPPAHRPRRRPGVVSILHEARGG